MRAKKILIPLLIVLLLLFVALPIALKLLFPEERLRAMIIPKAEEALARPVELGDVSLGFSLKGLTLELRDLSLGADSTGYGLSGVTLPELSASLAWRPLLRKEIEVRSLSLRGAEIDLRQMPASDEEEAAEVAAADTNPAPAFAVAAPDVRLADTRLRLDMSATGGGTITLVFPTMRFASAMDAAGALDLTGVLELSELSGALPQGMQTSLRADIEFALGLDAERLRLSKLELDMEELRLTLPGEAPDEPLRLSAASLRGDIEFEAPLAALTGPEPDIAALASRVAMTLEGLNMEQGEAVNVALSRVEAVTNLRSGSFHLELQPLELASPSLPAPLKLEVCRLAGDLAAVTLEALSLSTGASRVEIRGELTGLDAEPAMAMTLHSPHLETDDFLPPDPGETDAAPRAADEAPAPLLPPLPEGVVDFRVDRLVHPRTEITGLHGKLVSGAEGLTLEGLRGGILGGSLSGELALRPDEAGAIDCRGEFAVNGTRAPDFLAAFSPVKRGVEGVLSSDIQFEFTMPPGGEPQGLGVNADLDIADAALVNLPVARALATAAGLATRDRYPLGRVRQNVKVRNGRVITKDLRVPFEDGEVLLGGSAGLAGDLDFDGGWQLGPDTLKRLGPASNLAFLKNETGTVELDFHLGGTAASPRVTLDTSAMEARLKEQVKEELEEKGEELLQQGLDALRNRLK